MGDGNLCSRQSNLEIHPTLSVLFRNDLYCADLEVGYEFVLLGSFLRHSCRLCYYQLIGQKEETFG